MQVRAWNIKWTGDARQQYENIKKRLPLWPAAGLSTCFSFWSTGAGVNISWKTVIQVTSRNSSCCKVSLKLQHALGFSKNLCCFCPFPPVEKPLRQWGTRRCFITIFHRTWETRQPQTHRLQDKQCELSESLTFYIPATIQNVIELPLEKKKN